MSDTPQILDWAGRPASAVKKKKPPKKKFSQKGKPKNVKAASLQALEANRPQEVILTVVHSINGHRYGPGRVRVAGPIAAVLWEQERNSQQVEADFHDKRAFIIGAHKRVTQVPYDSFDYAYGAAMPVALNAF